MEIDEFQDILYEKEPETGIVTITFNQPQRKNAMSLITFLELGSALEAMEKDPEARVLILTGRGEAFSSGGYFNLSFMQSLPPEVLSQIDVTDIAQKKICLKFWKFDKPVIAAINGLAIGAGFTLPLACADLIYMAEEAYLRFPFTQIGVTQEFACSFLLPRLLGFQKAKELLFFPEKISAARALELGLTNGVVPGVELLSFVRDKARQLIPPQGAALALSLAKQAFHKPLIAEISAALDQENLGLNRAFGSEDFFEALMARMEKRPPKFKGR
jgi:enoyl-CoA hydratase/carnithine racemase